jgi:DNA-binding MarR family transcriptional regulator
VPTTYAYVKISDDTVSREVERLEAAGWSRKAGGRSDHR